MGSLIKKTLSTLAVPLCLLFLLSCGMGGTEIGNPRPGAEPTEGDTESPSFDGPTPSPSPAAMQIEEMTFEIDQET